MLGEHPDGGRVQAGLGRFGPYVVWDKGKGEKDYRSLKGDDDVLAVGLTRALELLAMPKRGRGGRTALKDLGKPEGSDETIQVYDGPYGLYVKQGKVNASLPEGKKPMTSLSRKRWNCSPPRWLPRKAVASPPPRNQLPRNPRRKKPAAKKPPATTKTGRLRASAVRVIKPGDR